MFPPKCRSSIDMNVVLDEGEISPTKLARKPLSPAKLMKIELQKNASERRLPLLKLQADPTPQTKNSGDSLSSFSSLEEKMLESPTRLSPDSKKKPQIPPLGDINGLGSLQFADFDKHKNDGVCLSERKFVVNISKPSLFLQYKKNDLPETDNKKKSDNIETLRTITEEESPLMRVIRKKKEQDRHKQFAPQNANSPLLKKVETSFFETHPFRNLIFAPKIDENLFKKHLLLTYKGVVYSQKLVQPTDRFLEERGINLPEKTNSKKTLFMDLDETLIHACHIMENPEIVLDIKDGNLIKKVGFNIRPYCSKFLEKVSKYFEIYVFTASSELYANSIIAKIDPNKRILQIFNKTSTMNTKNGFVIKDLRIFRNKNLKDMIIVDNLSHSFSFQIDNGIPLLEWQSDKNDEELKYLYKYLKKAQNYNDLRVCNREYLKLQELGNVKIEDLGL